MIARLREPNRHRRRPTVIMRTSAPLLALAAIALVAGCGGADQTASGTSTAAAPAAGIAHPTGARDVVVRVASGGGFVAVEANLASLPSYTLYGDGTVIRTVAAPAGSALALGAGAAPQLETGHLDEAAVQELLSQAERAGLLAPGAIDYGDMGSVGVADMPTTTVTLTTDAGTVDRAAYALGGGTVPGGHDLSAAQQSARAALSGFVALTEGSPADATPYLPERLAVFVAPWLEQPDVATDAEPAELPLAADLAALTKAGANSAAGFGCTVVDGEAVPKLLAATASPSPSGLWRAPGGHEAYRVVVRPLLPDETGCPA
jgi:hypothetical protein